MCPNLAASRLRFRYAVTSHSSALRDVAAESLYCLCDVSRPGTDGRDPPPQFNGNQARISGGNNKCASAQWDANYEGGVDYAAVAYACAVGSGPLTGTATLERTKQW